MTKERAINQSADQHRVLDSSAPRLRAVDPGPSETQGPMEGRLHGISAAASVLFIAGVLIVHGSFATWEACPKEPCEGDGGLFHIFPRTGIDLAFGFLTAGLGIMIALVALYVARGRPHRIACWIALAGSFAVGAVLLAYAGRSYAFPMYAFRGPYEGVILVGIGALAGAASSAVLLRHARRSTPAG